MSGDLHRILYCSRNLIERGEVEQQAELANILETARANNSRQDVTGALLYGSGFFAQVLEGPGAAVEKIFEKIQQDFRHGDITVLESGAAKSRDFPDWSMAHVVPPSAEQSAKVGAALGQALSNPSSSGGEVLELLRTLVIQEN